MQDATRHGPQLGPKDTLLGKSAHDGMHFVPSLLARGNQLTRNCIQLRLAHRQTLHRQVALGPDATAPRPHGARAPALMDLV